MSVGKHAPVTVKGLNEPEYSSSENTIKSAAILLRLQPAGCMLELFNIGIEFIIFRGGIHPTKLLLLIRKHRRFYQAICKIVNYAH